MTEQALVALIVSFCNITKATDLEHGPKRACAMFMVNCSVAKNSSIEERRVNECKDLWNNNKEKLIKEYETK